MITPAQRAEIRRLYFGEHWTVGTIAAALGVNHETARSESVPLHASRHAPSRRCPTTEFSDRIPSIPRRPWA